MKTIIEINSQKVPPFKIDPSLDKYDDVILFPEKLAKSNEDLKSSNLLGLINEMRKEKSEKK